MPDQPGTGASTDSPTVPDFAAYEAAQNAIDLGAQPSRDVTPDSSPAPSGTQSTPTGVKDAAASETATPDEQKPPRKNLDTRHQELDGSIEALQRKLEIKRELEKQLGERPTPAKPTESQPVKAEPEWKRYAKHPHAPKVEDFDTYEEYVDARSTFIADQRLADRDRHAQLDARSRDRMSETEKQIAGFTERITKAREADPDFETKIAPGLREIVPAFAVKAGEPLRPANVLLQEVVTSEHSAALLLHFSTDEGRAEWNTLIASPHPAAMLKGFGRVEARFESSGQAAAGKTPAAKPVTSAPAPPRTLGNKPPTDPDRAASAVKAGDYRAYEAQADAADLARLRR